MHDDLNRYWIMALTEVPVTVLGGAGFIGSRLIERLVEVEQARVTVLARSPQRAIRIARYPVRLIAGSVTEPVPLRQALAGARLVFDCTYPVGGDVKARSAEAVAMAQAIADGVRSESIRRLVHLSTVAVYGVGPGERLDEASPCRPGGDAYAASKLAAEQWLLRCFQDRGLPVVVIQPTVVYGPFSHWISGPLAEVNAGRVVLPEGGVCNPVYIDDLIDGMLKAAMVAGIEGERFLLSGADQVTWYDYYRQLSERAGANAPVCWPKSEIERQMAEQARRDKPFRRLVQELRSNPALRQLVLALPPLSWIRRLAERGLGDARWQQTKRRLLDAPAAGLGQAAEAVPLIYPQRNLALYASRSRVSIDKARQQLGYGPRHDLSSGLERSIDWARWAGLIRGS